MKIIILKLVILISVAGIAGCGTVKGIGEDMKSLGKMLSGGSDHYKEAIGKNPPGSKMKTKSEY